MSDDHDKDPQEGEPFGRRPGYRDHPDDPSRPLGELGMRAAKLGARILQEATDRLRERGEDLRPRDLPRELIVGVANLGIRGKEEILTLAAKEVRGYFEKLKVGDELRSLLTEHSLEIQASVRLKPVLGGEPLKPEDVRVGAEVKDR
jgi:hypothetical protein